jgi:hypothetical protein
VNTTTFEALIPAGSFVGSKAKTTLTGVANFSPEGPRTYGVPTVVEAGGGGRSGAAVTETSTFAGSAPAGISTPVPSELTTFPPDAPTVI